MEGAMRKSVISAAFFLALAFLLPYPVTAAAELTASLSPDKTSPQPPYASPGDEITWTATASGGTAPYTYTFRSWTAEGGIVVEQTGSSNIWTWTPAAGNYQIQVIVDDSSGASVATDWVSYQIETGMTLDSFTADKLSPQPPYWVPGDEITWTANVSGGTPPYTYTFRTWTNAAGTVVGQAGSSNIWKWEPTVPDDYSVQVMMTDSLGQTVVSSWNPYSIVADELQLVSLTPDKESVQPPYTNPGDEIIWTANVSGGSRGLTYTFSVWTAAGGTVDMQTGSSNTWVWRPDTVGKYSIRVTVIDGVGQVVTSAWVDYMIDQPITIDSFTSDKASPQPPYWQPGDEITWTATASGGTGQLTYRFRTWTTAGYVDKQIGSSNTWAWEPTVPNDDYSVQVIVSDSVGQYVASNWVHYSIKATPLDLNSFTADKAAPQPPYASPGDEITWTANASGGNRGLTYTFRTYVGGVTTVQQTGASNTWIWSPTVPADYSVQVVVTDGVGQQVSSAWVHFRIGVVLQSASLSPDKASPQAPFWSPGDEITWTATATGGSGTLTYRFRTWSKSTGSVDKQIGPSNTWAWRPSTPGDYSVQVIVSDSTGQVVASNWVSYSIKLTPLVLNSFSADKASPQPPYSNPGDEITWTANTAGGNGALTYTFRTWNGSSTTVGQSGAANTWIWKPVAGNWSVQVIVKDSFGQQATSGWVPYLVADPLYFDSLSPDRASSQPVGTTITWTAAAHGGNYGYTYTFRSYSFSTGMVTEQTGGSNTWNWTPAVATNYQIQVMVKDGVGQSVSSNWVDFTITP